VAQLATPATPDRPARRLLERRPATHSKEMTMYAKTTAALLISVGLTASAAVAHADSGVSPESNGALNPLLLGPRQVSAITGAEMVEAKLQTELGKESSFTDATRCTSAWAPSQAAAYAGAPYSSFSAANLADAKSPTPAHYTVAEAVFEFSSTSTAAGYVNQAVHDWQQCSNRTVSYQPPEMPVTQWYYGAAAVSSDGLTLSMPQHPETAVNFSCERALTHRANLVIDTMACGTTSAGQAVTVASAIGDRIARSV
jgi:hypothetical protein